MSDLSKTGVNGTAGVSGIDYGDSGTAGASGGDVVATNVSSSDVSNSVSGYGGSGGAGGYGHAGRQDPNNNYAFVGPGGNGGAGGNGGSASATASTIATSATPIFSGTTATTLGGSGGTSGIPGGGAPPGAGAPGGRGGDTSAVATMTGDVNVVSATVSAAAQGGVGGGAYGNGDGGSHPTAGAGGTVTSVSASGSLAGAGSLSVSTVATAGTSGSGVSGGNGANGVDLSESNTVTGSTNGGQLVLNQTVAGGGGGFAGLTGATTSYGGHAGAGGSAGSTLTFDDRNSAAQSASVSANVTAYGGFGGGTIDGDGASAGSATAGVDLTGANDVIAEANANGGGGGSSGIGRVFGNSGTGNGAGGAAATGHAAATTTGTGHSATAFLQLQGGAGGGGAGVGFNAGSAHGLTASDGSASATANGTGSTASSSAIFIGGSGGRGTQGAAAGNGGDVTVANDATASSIGGSVVLVNVARAGTGGGSDAPTSTNVAGGAPGRGGNASSTEVLTDTTAASIQSTVIAEGGGGGFASNQSGGAGGTALANATMAAQGDVRLDEVATGGNGGQGLQSSLTASPAAGGHDGATAESHASATSTSTLSASILGRQMSVSSTAKGGAGGTASGAGATGGNGALGFATAFGSDTSASSTVRVNGTVVAGSGGAGYNGANGGNGASADMVDAVSGQAAGGQLFLAQSANAGSGGSTTSSAGGSTGGVGGEATSTLTVDDSTTTTHTAAALLNAATIAFAGSGGSNIGGGGGGTGRGGDATAATNATGLVVDAEANAGAGSGGLISFQQPGSGNGGAGGKATASAIGSAGSADPNAPISYDTARATANGGYGGEASGAGFRGGDGGTASVTASMVTTDARDIYVRAMAYGGGGGGGSNGADAGDGADVSLVNAVSGVSNGGTITLQQDAHGGDSGISDTGQNGIGGSATSKLTFDDQNNATLSTKITSQIDAYSGRGAATSDAEATITGVGTVSATTAANGGNLSTAISRITGRSVLSDTSAHAVDSGNGFVSNLTVEASTSGDGTAGTVNETAIVGSGQQTTAFSVDQQSIATLMAAPVPAPKPFALHTLATTVTTPSPVIASVELGGGHTSDTTSGAQTTAQNVTYAFDASQINGNPDLIISFDDGTLVGDTSAFGSLTLSIFISGSTHSYNQFKTFSSATAADTFFHNNTIDVGSLSSLGSGRIFVTVHATETFSAPGGYYFSMQSSTPCYCTGTLIRTARGDVAVEDLAIGDLAVTASGAHRPIKWIGHRSYIGRFANANPDVLPICFKAGSLADSVPSRDLWVSPKHAMFLDGALIPAEHLVNGATITRAERVDSVEYWHIELDSHDVLIAEGAEAESFVDDNGRGFFHNAHTFRELYPDAREVEAIYCAPRVESGYALEAVRRRLAERAGLTVAAARTFGKLRGHVDGCDGARVWGWAQDLAHPDGPVCLDIVVDGRVVGLVYADKPRGDLAKAGIGDGAHAFSFALPAPLRADEGYTVTVRRSADGAVLRGRARAYDEAKAPAAAA